MMGTRLLLSDGLVGTPPLTYLLIPMCQLGNALLIQKTNHHLLLLLAAAFLTG
jgi:hypothetical protein